MRTYILLLIVAVTAASVRANLCTNHDPSTCTHTCPSGENKICEHDVCTCGKACSLVEDCPDCPSITNPMGHEMNQDKHCIDGGCVCAPDHMPPGGHHPPGRR